MQAILDWDGRVCGVSFIYGQRHTKEADHAEQICDHTSCAFLKKDISGIIGQGGLTDNSLIMPQVSYDDLPTGVSPTYVPFRNGTFLSAITSLAATDPEAAAIYFGAHADDAANWAYPDCTPEFIGGMANAIYIGTYHRIRLYTPLIFMNKRQIVRRGYDIGAPLEMTWSCYEGGEIHCGTCPTCRSRREGFIHAGISDPTRYVA
jgi:7-cyano-7-deazaguanine synthase